MGFRHFVELEEVDEKFTGFVDPLDVVDIVELAVDEVKIIGSVDIKIAVVILLMT